MMLHDMNDLHPPTNAPNPRKRRDPKHNAACEQQGAAGQVRRGLPELLVWGLRAAALLREEQ